MSSDWFLSWFDTPYYHILYKNRDYSEASKFIDNIIKHLNLEPNSKCWDLCCGKGRHSIHLNEKGFYVTGTDISEESINHALKYSSNTLEFYKHDMRKLFRTNYFDAVFNLFTSFGYFEKQHDDYLVFSSVEKSLKKNGVFVFDYLNASYVKANMIPHEIKTLDGINFNISKTIEHNTVIKNIDFEDNAKLFHFEERVKLFDKSYFEALAKQCQLDIVSSFGNYDLAPFDEQHSPRLILIMRKQ